jgi:hypothetical protein
MSYDRRQPPTPTITRENPAFTAWVERRAVDLCTDAESGHDDAYTAGIPCFEHLTAARSEGFDYWHKARAELGQAGDDPDGRRFAR